MNLGKILLRILPVIGPILQGFDRDSQRASDSGESYSETSPNLGTIWNSVVNKYTGAGLTQAEREANVFTAEQSQLAWERSQKSADIAYQRELEASNTQYQRKVADLQAAGLNPMLAVATGGSAVPSASVASSSPGSSVSPGFGNLSELLSFFSRLPLLKAQIENVKADTDNKEADTLKKSAEAASTEQQINYFDRVKGFREEAESLSGDIKRSEWKEIEQRILESKQNIVRSIAETHESEKRADLVVEQAVLARAEADNIVYMQPFISAELSARTSQEKAQCRVLAVEEAYQQKLIDEGSIEAAVRASNANASNAEIESKVKEFNQGIRDGSLRKSALKQGDWQSNVVFGLYEALGNAVKTIRGNW